MSKLPNDLTFGIKPFVSTKEGFSGLMHFIKTNDLKQDELNVLAYVRAQLSQEDLLLDSFQGIARKTNVSVDTVTKLVGRLKNANIITVIQDELEGQRTLLHVTFLTQKEMIGK